MAETPAQAEQAKANQDRQAEIDRQQNEAKQETKEPIPAPVPYKPQMRAKFIVTEITKTSRGVNRITLAAQHDPSITSDKTMMGSHTSPSGNITLEVNESYATDRITFGSVFYLVSA